MRGRRVNNPYIVIAFGLVWLVVAGVSLYTGDIPMNRGGHLQTGDTGFTLLVGWFILFGLICVASGIRTILRGRR